MAGFTVIFSESRLPDKLFNDQVKTEGFIDRSIRYDNLEIRQHTNAKFSAEKILSENDEFLIVTDGVILNLPDLLIKYSADNVFVLLCNMYKSVGDDFVDLLRGDFSGFIYNKVDKNFLAYTNHTGSKRIFHFESKGYVMISSDLQEISRLRKKLHMQNVLNSNAAYFLLTNGFMLETHTLIENVYRLMPGSMLIKQGESALQVNNYFHLKNITKTTDSKAEIIEKMDLLFAKAVKLEFEKDIAYGYKHVATLSGGLDSRMVVLMAHKLGYTDQLNFTFSQANYLDEKIARKIANDYQHQFHFQSLENGDYLKCIDRTVQLNDGLMLFSGAAHVLYTIGKMDFSEFGLIHTGLIGDAVIGSFLTQPIVVAPALSDGMYSTHLSKHIQTELENIVSKYDSEEIYKFYSRAFLGAMNGYYMLDTVSQATSPFLDVDFLSYCISIPEELKYKQQIYLEWIAAKHPEFAKYPWEKTGVSPLKSNNYMKYFDFGYYRRMSLKFFDKISGKTKSGMNPFDYWMGQNPSLEEYARQYFTNHISLLDTKEQVQIDCIKMFEEGNSSEKFQVLSLLAAIKLHDINN